MSEVKTNVFDFMYKLSHIQSSMFLLLDAGELAENDEVTVTIKEGKLHVVANNEGEDLTVE